MALCRQQGNRWHMLFVFPYWRVRDNSRLGRPEYDGRGPERLPPQLHRQQPVLRSAVSQLTVFAVAAGQDGAVLVHHSVPAAGSDVKWPLLCRLCVLCEWADLTTIVAVCKVQREGRVLAALCQFTSLVAHFLALQHIFRSGLLMVSVFG